MSNRPDCKPPDLEEHEHVFRQTFLARLPEYAPALAQLAEMLNAGSIALEDDTRREPPLERFTVRLIGALAADAEHLGADFYEQAEGAFQGVLDPRDALAWSRVFSWGHQLLDIAAEVRAEVADLRAAEDDEEDDDDEDGEEVSHDAP